MPIVKTPNTARAELRYSYHNVECENVFNFEHATEPDVAALNTLANELNEWWIAAIRPNQPTVVTLREIYIRSMHSEIAPQTTRPVNSSGSQSGAAMSNNVTFCLKLNSGLTGRSTRGRVYHIGLLELDVTANQLDSATAIELAAGYALLINAVQAFNWTWVVNSQYSGGDKRTQGLNTPITSVSYSDLTVDTQRRRLR